VRTSLAKSLPSARAAGRIGAPTIQRGATSLLHRCRTSSPLAAQPWCNGKAPIALRRNKKFATN
jgi:hypothetical protein